MNWRELNEELAEGKIAPVYLFYGTEGYLLERALEKLKEKLVAPGAEAFDCCELDGRETTAAAVVLEAATPPALAAWRLVVVKEPGAEILQGEELHAYLADPFPSTCLVLVAGGDVDKRLKVIKLIERAGRVVEFAPLKTRELEKWLQQEAAAAGYSLLPAAAQILAQAAGGELRPARNELFKVMTYMGRPGAITPDAVLKLLPAAAAQATVFQLVDALGNRNAPQAVALLRRLLDRGEQPLGVLSMLARQLRLIYQYHLAADQREFAAKSGLKYFVVQKIAAQAGNFSLEGTGRALNELLKADVAIKSGRGTAGSVLERAIWAIIKGEP